MAGSGCSRPYRTRREVASMSSLPTAPETSGDERGALLGYLTAQRHSIRRSVYGLTDGQARSRPTPSALSLAGILKHVSHGEEEWVRTTLANTRADYMDPEVLASQAKSFTPEGEEESVEALLLEWERIAEETERVVRRLPSLDETFHLPPAPWDEGGERSWRWMLLHFIEEFSRHSGHADIIRESLDGKTAVELLTDAGDFEWKGP